MSLYRALARYLFAPCLDALRGTHVLRCLRELEESQWWPPERIAELQSERLQWLVHYSYECVPHYRRLMDGRGLSPGDIRTVADLPLLPVLTKSDVRDHTGGLLASTFPPRALLYSRTSGSTGSPLAFYSSRQGRWSHGFARSLRALEWAHVYPGDPVLRVSERGDFVGGAPLARLVRLFSRESFEDPVGFTDATLPGVIDRMRQLRPQALRGYASALCVIADFIRSSGQSAPEVGAIVTGGEQLFESQRALLREVFGREPFSKYSSFENYDIAMECQEHAGLHVAAEDLVVEVVDDEGRPLAPGSIGRVIVTNLHEYGMPLIRYDTSDEGSLIEGVCKCGRSLPRLSAVIGRTGGTIYTPSGKRLSTVSLDSSGLVPLGICAFQLVQEQIDHVTVNVVLGAEAAATDPQALTARVQGQFVDWLGYDVHVDVAIVDRITPTPAGKHMYLISHVTSPPDR